MSGMVFRWPVLWAALWCSLCGMALAENCLTTPAVPALPMAGQLEVTAFGATPDDLQDDTAAIQRAIDTARAGQWVVFPRGRYLHNKSIVLLKPGITLWGEGATLHATNPDDQAIFLKADDSRVYGFTLTAVTRGRRTEPWATRIAAFGREDRDGHITGIVVQNNRIVPAVEAAGSPLSHSASAAGILMLGVRNFTVANNTVRRSLADAIHITGGSRNGRVTDNRVSQSGDDMIGMVSYLDKQWRTRQDDEPGWWGRHRDESLVSDIWVHGNVLEDAYWGRGISVVGGQNITIDGNQISRVAMAAGVLVARESSYHTHGVRNVLIQRNQIEEVQTQAPRYLPQGEPFRKLLDRLQRDGGRTFHGAIEVHNLSEPAERDSVAQRAVLGVSGVVVRGNAVRVALKDGVRIGVGRNPEGVQRVWVTGNQVAGVGGRPYEILARQVATDSKVPADLRGASLDCQAFPRP